MKQVLAILAILGLIVGLNAKTYSIAYYGMQFTLVLLLIITHTQYYTARHKAIY